MFTTTEHVVFSTAQCRHQSTWIQNTRKQPNMMLWGETRQFYMFPFFLKLCSSHFGLINYNIVSKLHSCLLKISYLNNSTKPTCIANIFQPNWPTIDSPPGIGIGIFSPDFTAFPLWAFIFCRGCLVHPALSPYTTHQKKKKLKNNILHGGYW